MSLEHLENLNFASPLLHGEDVSTNGQPDSPPAYPTRQTGLKRQRIDDCSMGIYSSHKVDFMYPDLRPYHTSRSFLSIRHNIFIYHTEEWKPKGSTMYSPLTEDIMINTHNIDQLSFETDQFFLADEKGNYAGAKPGNAIHLWRFDQTTKKLYISRSILFLKEQDYQDIQIQLQSL